jgi:hypothetical protein
LIFLLAALMSGYALGTFLAKNWKPYALCLPVSLLLYFVTSAALSLLSRGEVAFPNPGLSIAAGLVQTPILMLGVYLAQRKAKRAGYDT